MLTVEWNLLNKEAHEANKKIEKNLLFVYVLDFTFFFKIFL